MITFLKSIPQRLQRFWTYTLGDQTIAGGGASLSLQSTSGQLVTPMTSMSVPDVFCAINVISSAGASLSIDVIKQTGNRRDKDNTHAAYNLLNVSPDGQTTAVRFRQAQFRQVLGYGNSLAEIVFTGTKATSMHLLCPFLVQAETDEDGVVSYRVFPTSDALARGGKNDSVVLPSYRVFHFAGLSHDGLWGISPVQENRRAISMSMASAEFASNFYQTAARPAGYFTQKSKLPAEALKAFKESFAENYSGALNAGKQPVIPFNLDWHQIPLMSMEDSGWVEAMKLTTLQIAKIFNIPPDKLQDWSQMKYNTPEAADLNFYRNCLSTWLVAYEQEANRKLFAPSEQKTFCIRHDLTDRLRGDETSQANYMVKCLFAGGTVNEAREFLGLNPTDKPYGDLHFIPANMLPLEMMGTETHLALAKGNTTANIADDSPAEETAEPAKANDAQLSVVKSKAISAFADNLSRVVRKECSALRRSAKNPPEFHAWLDTFYCDHRRTIAEQTIATYSVLAAVTGDETPLDVVCQRIIDESTEQLLAIAGSEPDATLPAKIDRLCTKWEASKAADIVARLTT